MKKRLVAIALLLPLGSAACSLLVGTDGLAGGTDADGGLSDGRDAAASMSADATSGDSAAAGDATSGDAGGGSDANDCVPDTPPTNVGPELLSGGDMEDGCASWNASQSTRAGSPTAHTGALSCRMCSTGITAFTYGILRQELSFSPQPGEKYLLSAFVHADPASATPLKPAALGFDHGGIGTGVMATETPASTCWTKVVVDFTVPDGGTADAVDVYAGAGNNEAVPAGPCLLFDDVSLRKQNNEIGEVKSRR
jgi:Carbohydrate binding domain